MNVHAHIRDLRNQLIVHTKRHWQQIYMRLYGFGAFSLQASLQRTSNQKDFDKKEIELDINFEGVFGLQNLFKLSGFN